MKRWFEMAGAGGTTPFDEAEMQAEYHALSKTYTIMAFAGFAIDRLRGYTAEWSDSQYGSDRSSVEHFQRQGDIPEANLPGLRDEAKHLVAEPLIRYSIYDVAIELRRWSSLSAQDIWNILRNAPERKKLIRQLRRWDRKFRVDS